MLDTGHLDMAYLNILYHAAASHGTLKAHTDIRT